MRIWYDKQGVPDGSCFDANVAVVRIGSSAECDLVLSSPFVDPLAAVLRQADGHWEILPMGHYPVRVGGHRVSVGQRVLLSGGETIEIEPFSLRLEGTSSSDGQDAMQAVDAALSEFIMEVHRQLLARMDLTGARDQQRDNDDFLLPLERDLEEISRLQGLFAPSSSELRDHSAGHAVQAHLLDTLLESAHQPSDPWRADGRWTRLYTAVPDFERELGRLAQGVADELQLDRIKDLSKRIETLDRRYWSYWQRTRRQLYDEVKDYLASRYIKKQIKDIVFGYGPLEDLLRLPNINEVMVVNSERIYVEKNGRLEKSGRRFVSDEVTVNIIEQIVTRVHERIDRAQPLADACLSDGSRVNAVIPPLAQSGPCLTIRKFPRERMRIDDLVELGALTPTVREFLKSCVLAHKNIIVSGGTGSGKTTLLNALSDFIPDKERIVTIEDTTELRLGKLHVISLKTKMANVEGKGAYTVRDLVRNALRMRPDRIVVGECRGAEALDMLQAMNTGHDGSMTTIHANSTRDVILRLEVLVQMGQDVRLPVQSIHRQIASAVDVVVQLTRLRERGKHEGGRRIISQVTEFVDFDDREEAIRTKDLFRLSDGPEPVLAPTGALPSFMGELIESGLISLEAFYL